MLFGATRPLTGAFSLTAMQAGLAVESVLVDPASNIEQYVCRFDDEVVDVERMDSGLAWCSTPSRRPAHHGPSRRTRWTAPACAQGP
ncbi:MAG: hypothetical protein V9E94_06170 [Microthrixaceae bacterium]